MKVLNTNKTEDESNVIIFFISFPIYSYCFYIVPEYVFGIPRYDTLQCANFLIKILKHEGFIVSYTYPNLIFIVWEHIPSEVTKNALLVENTNKETKKKDTSYREIQDYKSSKEFLNRIN